METRSPTWQTLQIYWQHAKKYKAKLWIIYPSMVVAQFAEDFLQTLLISAIITDIARGNTDRLAIGVVWKPLLFIVLLEAFGHLMWNKVVIPTFWKTQDKIMRDLNMTVFKHLQLMSHRFFSDRFAGSLVNQTNKFVGSFERLTDPLTWNVFKLLVAVVFTTIILAPKAMPVVVGIWVIALIYIPVVWHFRQRQLPYNRRWAASETKRTGQLADAISNIVAVKSFANEQAETARMQERANAVHNRSIETMKIAMRQELVSGSLQRSINVITIVVSVVLASSGNLDVGIIYLALTYTLGIMRRLWDLNNSFRQFTRVFGDASDMTEILQIKPEVADPDSAISFEPKDSSIEFVNVDFWYPDDDENSALFKDFHLSIKPGEKVGLVGPSGGGKTSITNLLLRFMDIQSGKILIGNQTISSVRQRDLRKNISYVPQEPLLFHRTLAENISYGKPDASMNEVVIAAKKAHAHEFIQKLPNGYETLVGERGVKLSGGQRQRVAIARAMIKDAPILVLDEATSALDSESEKLIQTALWKLMEGRTTIVIAHRLSTIAHMDRIVVLDKGRIVEEGTHKDLVKKKDGLYARLWSHQSGGFLED